MLLNEGSARTLSGKPLSSAVIRLDDRILRITCRLLARLSKMSVGMRNFTGRKKRIPRGKPEPLIADLHDIFPFNDIEALVLDLMDMQGRATFQAPMRFKHRPGARIVLA